jgi:catechol 2,3-dioxygenase-like lactoylglutathione lyase family enzyme
MESVIAALLRDFEQGKMSRRQLIQSLAMAAAAAAAPGTALAQAAAAGAQTPAGPPPSQAQFGKAPWKTVWLDHISFQVSDYKKSVEFYTNLMGWEVQNDNGASQATLKIGEVGGIIIRNSRRRPDGQGTSGAAASGAAAPAPPPSQTAGAGQGNQAPRAPISGVIDHISWGIDSWDTDKVKAELERRGLNPRPDMVGDNFKSFHVKDPDGWDLQISNKTSNRD